MMKGFFIIAACLLWVVADSAVILHHQIPPKYYTFTICTTDSITAIISVPINTWRLWIMLLTREIITTQQTLYLAIPWRIGDDVKRLLADYSFNDIEGRTGIGSGTEDIRIPNYRLFHFVLRLVRTMRRHFLPVYATHPDDISNIYAQYNEHELRRRNA
uniref:Uncharacterized protein n=1 Tax=Daphnia galeata TaxID=27404 RepID=A0A8J2RTA3_9CRUS|nr:unnamed protein product [Daphnia galeata]